MKKAFLLFFALLVAVGLVWQQILPADAAADELDIERLRYDDHIDLSGRTVEILDAGTPTSYQVGYGVEENTILDTAVVTLKGNTLIATGIGTATVQIDGEIYEITVDAAPISLLLHTLFGREHYPLNGADADMDGNGKVDQEDAVYLLLHTLFGEAFYPLKTS